MENDKTSSHVNTIKRIITGFLMGIVCLSCFSVGGVLLFLILVVFVLAGAYELIKILQHKGFYPNPPIVYTICILLLLLVKTNHLELYPFCIVLGVIASFLSVLFSGKQPYTANISSTIFCCLYGSLPCFLLLVREMTDPRYVLDCSFISFRAGFYFLWIIFFSVLMTDVCAFFVGKKYGKRKLAPVVSPKKTIEGAVAGAVGAVLSALLIGSFIHLPFYHSFFLGLIITLFAQLGDLCESLIKRDAGVKDSGTALAGHGGFLDRADSYTFSLPVAYFYLQFFVLQNDWFVAFFNLIKDMANAL